MSHAHHETKHRPYSNNTCYYLAEMDDVLGCQRPELALPPKSLDDRELSADSPTVTPTRASHSPDQPAILLHRKRPMERDVQPKCLTEAQTPAASGVIRPLIGRQVTTIPALGVGCFCQSTIEQSPSLTTPHHLFDVGAP
jgi:hypothetical protein